MIVRRLLRILPSRRVPPRRSICVVGAAALVALVSAPRALRAQRLEGGGPAARMSHHVEVLASERFGGRGPDSGGLERARAYVTAQMKGVGLEPAGQEGWSTPIEVVVAARPTRDSALKIGDGVLARGAQFEPLGCSGRGDFEGQVVFVGYGLSMPQRGWDEYAGVDVEGKVVVALAGAPPELEAGLGPEERYLLGAQSKAAVALAHRAQAFLLVNDPRSHGDRVDQRADEVEAPRIAEPLEGLAAGALTHRAARRALGPALELERLQRALDARGAAPVSRALEVRARGDLGVARERATVHNVVGRLPGADPAAGPVIFGAHYDGLGYGYAGSLGEPARALHPGADDNASGVALMLEVARELARRREQGEWSPRRPVWFMALAAEEIGQRGSRRAAAQLGPRAPQARVVTVDMVGRLRPEGLSLVGLGRWPEGAREQLVQIARRHALAVQARPVHDSTSDHLAFLDVGAPTLHLTTGRHGDYHTPGDVAARVEPSAAIWAFTSDTLAWLAGRP